MSQPAALRARAEALAGPLPPLLAEADRLASTVILGAHGRRKAGLGDDFWQFRPAEVHDEARAIDWRRSARADATFVREKEWQISQSVSLWVDRGASMSFQSVESLPTKGDRAQLLALATAIVLDRGGERVGLAGSRLTPRRGHAQVGQIAEELGRPEDADYGVPSLDGVPAGGRAVFLSDFLGDLDAVEAAVTGASDRGVLGVLCQILDPAEEAFPFRGRTIFESMTGALRHETLKAGDLKARYLDRLAERRARLERLAALTGWQFTGHRTDQGPASALLWIYGALERRG